MTFATAAFGIVLVRRGVPAFAAAALAVVGFH
jgi:hypothetical protein